MTYRRDTDTEESVPTGRQNTSRASAKETNKTNKNIMRQRIHDTIKYSAGLTCDEIEQILDIRHQSASCIIRFLTKDGFLQDSGKRRPTRSGRQAIVWQSRPPMKPGAVQLDLINDPMRGA